MFHYYRKAVPGNCIRRLLCRRYNRLCRFRNRHSCNSAMFRRCICMNHLVLGLCMFVACRSFAMFHRCICMNHLVLGLRMFVACCSFAMFRQCIHMNHLVLGLHSRSNCYDCSNWNHHTPQPSVNRLIVWSVPLHLSYNAHDCLHALQIIFALHCS